jgi:hypothetical protein
MRYYIKQDFIDNEILNGLNDYQIARVMKCTPGYIHHLRKGIRTASMDFYIELKARLGR